MQQQRDSLLASNPRGSNANDSATDVSIDFVKGLHLANQVFRSSFKAIATAANIEEK